MTSNIIQSKFDEWTKGLSAEDARISVFDHIRDILYYMDPALFDLEKGPTKMLEQCDGSCTPKHYLLGEMFGLLEIEVKYLTFRFRWDDMDVESPKEVRALASVIPDTYHLACRVMLDGKWVLVDATWDTGLKESGFPVNEKWNGFADTVLAVKSLEEIVHDTASTRHEDITRIMKEYTLPEKLELARFSAACNSWMKELRGGETAT
ncbi:MAG: hypothetical protein P9L88_01660 [Candidatus Tantalella remota]|nr:hypothetical protein [Candidatus Tantalella remota]